MEHGNALLLQVAVYFAAAVIAVMASHKLGLGSVAGYLLAGIAIGPWGLELIEQPEAIGNAFAIACATPRIAGIAFGHGDFSLAMGINAAPSTDGIVLHARCQVVIAAKAAGITPIDNVFLDIANIAGLAAETRQGKQLGYEGKACIHPNQVEPVNAVYTPTSEEVEYARELIAAFEQAVGEGKGAVAFRGRMIDSPIADIERIVLERARKAGL